MNEKKLQTKDLITAGVFAVLYAVLITVLASLAGMIIPLFLALPFFVGILLGPLYTLYISKVPKAGAVIILAALSGLVMSTTSVLVLVYVLVLGIIAQVILSKTNYSIKGIQLSYIIFAAAPMGPFLSLYFARDTFLNACLHYYGQEYVTTIDSLTPIWMFFVQLAIAFIGGFIGGRLGMKMNAKHFKKAGIA